MAVEEMQREESGYVRIRLTCANNNCTVAIAQLQLPNCNCSNVYGSFEKNLVRKLRSYHQQSITNADSTGAVAKIGGDSFHADLEFQIGIHAVSKISKCEPEPYLWLIFLRSLSVHYMFNEQYRECTVEH